MKYLGIDFGSKRVGLAVSDETGSLAFPFKVIQNDKKLFSNIKNIIIKNKIEKIVIGESKNFKMEDNEIMKEANIFSNKLKEETKCEIVFHPEFLTSVQIEREHFQASEKGKKRGVKKTTDVDAKAATIILQDYLDYKK